MRFLGYGVALFALCIPRPVSAAVESAPRIQEYPVPTGSHPHDVAPAPDGGVWYTAQRSGELGRLDPVTGQVRHIKLGEKSLPHGVIVGPDGAPWITDSGLSAIVRVDPTTEKVTSLSSALRARRGEPEHRCVR
jgi:virginiamycin B lyase